MYSNDLVSPDLQEILLEARYGFGSSVLTLWRAERLMRFVYWLNHDREHPPSNLIMSWTRADMIAEAKLWNSLRQQGVSADSVVEVVLPLLEERYGISLQEAVECGTNPELAAQHLPIWDRGTASLVPQRLGPWLIFAVENYEAVKAGLGWGYHYSNETRDAGVSLFLYGSGLGVGDGVDDPRVLEQVRMSTRDIEANAYRNGARDVRWLGDPTIVKGLSTYDVPMVEIEHIASATTADSSRQYARVAVTGFRGGFLKIRDTWRGSFVESADFEVDCDQCHREFADFYQMFRNWVLRPPASWSLADVG